MKSLSGVALPIFLVVALAVAQTQQATHCENGECNTKEMSGNTWLQATQEDRKKTGGNNLLQATTKGGKSRFDEEEVTEQQVQSSSSKRVEQESGKHDQGPALATKLVVEENIQSQTEERQAKTEEIERDANETELGISPIEDDGRPTPEAIMEEMDTDKDGFLSLAEFVSEVNMVDDEQKKLMETAFSAADADEDGKLSIIELSIAIQEIEASNKGVEAEPEIKGSNLEDNGVETELEEAEEDEAHGSGDDIAFIRALNGSDEHPSGHSLLEGQGCRCDIHSRRRHERCRYVQCYPGYFAKGCGIGERRRARLTRCDSGHQSELGSYMRCNGCWWDSNCGREHCVNVCHEEIGRWEGSWKRKFVKSGNSKYTVQKGTRRVDRRLTTSSYSRTVTKGRSGGVSAPFKGITFSAEVSRQNSQTWSNSYSQELTQEQTHQTTFTYEPAQAPLHSAIWQWKIDSYNNCGNFVGETETHDFEYSAGAWIHPCCAPGQWKSRATDPYTCRPGYELYQVYSDQNCPNDCVCKKVPRLRLGWWFR